MASDNCNNALKIRVKIWQIELSLILVIIIIITLFISLKISYFLFVFFTKNGIDANIAKYALLIISSLLFIIKEKQKILILTKLKNPLYLTQYLPIKDKETLNSLPSAIDFTNDRKTGNEELAKEHIKITFNKIKFLPYLLLWKKYFNTKNAALLAIAISLSLISPKNNLDFSLFINPVRFIYFEDFWDIIAEKEIVENEDFKLKICPKRELSYKPLIFIDKNKREFLKQSNCFEFTEKKVINSFTYYLKAGGIKSERYYANIIKKPEIETMRLKISYPVYLEKGKEELSFIPETLEIIEGTVLYFYFTLNTNRFPMFVELNNTISKYNEPIKKENNLYKYLHFPVRDEILNFYLNVKNYKKIPLSSTSIRILKDTPPDCKINNSYENIKLTAQQIYQLNYMAIDDTGIRQISLMKEDDKNILEEIVLENFRSYPLERNSYYLISPRDLKNKTSVNLQLKVVDLKRQTCLSPKFKIIIADMSQKHYENVKNLIEYINDITQIEKMLNEENFNIVPIISAIKNLEYSWDNILKKIEEDTLFEEWSKLNIRNAIKRLQQVSKEKLSKFQENQISKSEILSDFSNSKQELINSLNLNNIAEISNTLMPIENSFEKLQDLLNKENITKEEILQLKNEISYLIQEINELKELYRNLNETSNIKEKIFNVPLDEIAMNTIALNQALEKNNLKMAKEYLKKLADKLKQAVSAMKEFKEYSYRRNTGNIIKEQIKKINQKWQEIYEEEKYEFEENSHFFEKFYSEFENKRKKVAENLLQELFELKKSTLTIIQKEEVEKNIFSLRNGTTSLLLISPSEELLQNNLMVNENITLFLKHENFWDMEQKKFFNERLNNQTEILSKSFSLKRDIEINFYDEEAINKLNLAIEEMKNAKNSLLEFDIINTISSQLKAINYLKQGQEKFQNDIESFMKSFQESSSSIQSSYGNSANNVKIPGREDYIPPEFIKKEIVKTLSEDLPSETKEILNRYYKNITK